MAEPKKQNAKVKELKNDQKEYKQKWEEHKKQYLSDPQNTVKSMVYENGSALSFILRELYKLNDSINQIKNIVNGNHDKN